MKKLLTLCIIQDDARVLLGMKKRGFGAGRWNGFGGKLEEGETIENAAKREMFEEAGITVHDLKKQGVLEFEFVKSGDLLEVHLFRVNGYSGTPTESEEMKPAWFLLNEIPFDIMWPDDKYWFPLFLAGKKFKGRFRFGENDVVLNHELLEVEQLE